MLGDLYLCGSLLSFAMAQTAILALRVKRPDSPRPFKLGWNVRIRRRELPLITILGLLGTAAVLVVVIIQPYSRWGGFGWMLFGLVIYCFYGGCGGLTIHGECAILLSSQGDIY